MSTAAQPVFGPNDHYMGSGRIEPGLGPSEEEKIRAARGMGAPVDEPPDKAELRKQAASLSTKSKQLASIERALEKDRADMEADYQARLRAVEEREAQADALLKELGK